MCPICGDQMLYGLDVEYFQPVFFCRRNHTGAEFDAAIREMRPDTWPKEASA